MNRLVKIRWCSLLLLATVLRGQGEGSLPIRNHGLEQGLSNTAVTCLAEDPHGLLWTGTESGLFRFDGRGWHGVETALPSVFVNALLVDRKGLLWVATRTGVACFPPLRPDRLVVAQGVPPTIVAQLGEDAGGRIWVLAAGAPLVQAEGPGFAPDPAWPKAATAVALFAHPSCPEVLATDGRSFLVRHPDGTWRPETPPLQGPTEVLVAVAEDGTGARWARTDRAVYRRMAGSARWERVTHSLFGPSPDTARLSRDRDGWVWINTGSDLVRVRGAEVVPLEVGLELGESVTGLTDRSGSWWVGWAGIKQIPAGGAWRQYRQGSGLPSPVVWNLLRDRKGRLWAATDGGLTLAGPKGWTAVHRGQVSRVRQLHDGDLVFVGSPGGTVHRLDPRSRRVRSQRVDCLAPTAVMRGLAVLPDGGLLVSDFSDGVAHGRPRGERWTWQPTLVEGKPPLGVWTLQQDAGGNAFLAMDKALFQWVDGAWRRVPDTLDETPFLGLVRGDGTLLVSYFDRPVFSVHRREAGTWKRVSVHAPFEKAARLVVYSLVEGKNGDLWAGCSQGLVRLSGALERILDWQGPGEGAPGADANAGGLLLEADGDLWLGTTEGLGRFRSTAGPTAAVPAPVLVGPHGLLAAAAAPVLPPRGTLDASFAIPSFPNAKRLILQTRIAGLDQEWMDQETLAVRAGRLPPGTHTLEARFRLPGGASGASVNLPFRILPFWWETWWARAMGLLGLGGIAVGLHDLRARHLRRRNAQLEAQVAERLSELRSLMRRLEEEKQRADDASSAKSAFLAAMSHELRTPLNAILLYADLVKDEAEGRGEAAIARDMEKITGSGKHLLAMINDVLDLSKIEEGKMALHLEPVRVPELLEELASTLRPLASNRGNGLEVDCPADLPELRSDRTRLAQVLLNLGSNACKFTEGGTVRIEVEAGDRRMAFRVRDTGIGMSVEESSRIFDAYIQADSATHRRFGGTGLGLSISRKFVELLGGRLQVDSEPGRGSCFHFELPLPES